MTSQRFVFLDGCRAVPAVVVMLGHALAPFRPDPWPLSGLAVDFFFVLGAFVIMQAYSARVLGGMSLGAFLKARLKRLYPLHFLALLLGFLLFALKDGVGFEAMMSFALNLLFLPSPYSLAEGWSSGIVFNPSAWTLLFQMLANMVWWLLLVRMHVILQWFACVVLGILNFAQMLVSGDLWGGEFFENSHLGVLRALFPFTLGVCLWQLWRRRPASVVSGQRGLWLGALLGGVLLTCFIAPGLPGDGDAAFKMLVITVVFPVLIYLGAGIELRGPIARVFALGGQISYALYITHYCVVRVMSVAWRMLGADDAWFLPWCALELAVAVMFAWLLTRFFEVPLREGLGALHRRWRTAAV